MVAVARKGRDDQFRTFLQGELNNVLLNVMSAYSRLQQSRTESIITLCMERHRPPGLLIQVVVALSVGSAIFG
jgi:hypothetical protein